LADTTEAALGLLRKSLEKQKTSIELKRFVAGEVHSKERFWKRIADIVIDRMMTLSCALGDGGFSTASRYSGCLPSIFFIAAETRWPSYSLRVFHQRDCMSTKGILIWWNLPDSENQCVDGHS
jgi:hypothetical protein